MVAYTFIPQDSGGRGRPWVWGQLSLHGEFQGSQGYEERPCFKNKLRLSYFYLFILLYVYVGMCTVHVKVRGQLLGVISFLLPDVSQELKSTERKS